jgi:hypothetical protein
MTQRHYTRKQEGMVTEALTAYRKTQAFNYEAVASTPQERLTAREKLELIDSILEG